MGNSVFDINKDPIQNFVLTLINKNMKLIETNYNRSHMSHLFYSKINQFYLFNKYFYLPNDNKSQIYIDYKNLKNNLKTFNNSFDTFKYPYLLNTKIYFDQNKDKIYKQFEVIIRQYLKNNLYDFIHYNLANEEEKIFIIIQMLLSVYFIHKNGYFHGNLKPNNILLTSTNQVFLCDIGIIKPQLYSLQEFDKIKLFNENILEKCYISPERLINEDSNILDLKNLDKDLLHLLQKSDSFSLGCIIYEMFTNKVLFDYKLCNSYKSDNFDFEIINKDINKIDNEIIKNLIINLINKDHNERFSILDSIKFLLESIKSETILISILFDYFIRRKEFSLNDSKIIVAIFFKEFLVEYYNFEYHINWNEIELITLEKIKIIIEHIFKENIFEEIININEKFKKLYENLIEFVKVFKYKKLKIDKTIKIKKNKKKILNNKDIYDIIINKNNEKLFLFPIFNYLTLEIYNNSWENSIQNYLKMIYFFSFYVESEYIIKYFISYFNMKFNQLKMYISHETVNFSHWFILKFSNKIINNISSLDKSEFIGNEIIDEYIWPFFNNLTQHYISSKNLISEYITKLFYPLIKSGYFIIISEYIKNNKNNSHKLNISTYNSINNFLDNVLSIFKRLLANKNTSVYIWKILPKITNFISFNYFELNIYPLIISNLNFDNLKIPTINCLKNCYKYNDSFHQINISFVLRFLYYDDLFLLKTTLNYINEILYNNESLLQNFNFILKILKIVWYLSLNEIYIINKIAKDISIMIIEKNFQYLKLKPFHDIIEQFFEEKISLIEKDKINFYLIKNFNKFCDGKRLFNNPIINKLLEKFEEEKKLNNIDYSNGKTNKKRKTNKTLLTNMISNENKNNNYLLKLNQFLFSTFLFQMINKNLSLNNEEYTIDELLNNCQTYYKNNYNIDIFNYKSLDQIKYFLNSLFTFFNDIDTHNYIIIYNINLVKLFIQKFQNVIKNLYSYQNDCFYYFKNYNYKKWKFSGILLNNYHLNSKVVSIDQKDNISLIACEDGKIKGYNILKMKKNPINCEEFELKLDVKSKIKKAKFNLNENKFHCLNKDYLSLYDIETKKLINEFSSENLNDFEYLGNSNFNILWENNSLKILDNRVNKIILKHDFDLIYGYSKSLINLYKNDISFYTNLGNLISLDWRNNQIQYNYELRDGYNNENLPILNANWFFPTSKLKNFNEVDVSNYSSSNNYFCLSYPSFNYQFSIFELNPSQDIINPKIQFYESYSKNQINNLPYLQVSTKGNNYLNYNINLKSVLIDIENKFNKINNTYKLNLWKKIYSNSFYNNLKNVWDNKYEKTISIVNTLKEKNNYLTYLYSIPQINNIEYFKENSFNINNIFELNDSLKSFHKIISENLKTEKKPKTIYNYDIYIDNIIFAGNKNGEMKFINLGNKFPDINILEKPYGLLDSYTFSSNKIINKFYKYLYYSDTILISEEDVHFDLKDDQKNMISEAFGIEELKSSNNSKGKSYNINEFKEIKDKKTDNYDIFNNDLAHNQKLNNSYDGKHNENITNIKPICYENNYILMTASNEGLLKVWY